MPANSTGWMWHCLARETGNIGHLYSPGAQRGPWPWFPYALDNGAFSCWNMESNTFDDNKWVQLEPKWRQLIYWAASASQRPLWAVVPDTPGNAADTFAKWHKYYQLVVDAEIAPALAVQDGMTVDDISTLSMRPHVICVGGSTEWKWSTVEMWAKAFPRVHVLRCNSPEKLWYLHGLKVESCDGTGWNRGNKKQTKGVEDFARQTSSKQHLHSLWPYTCRGQRNGQLEWAF